MEQRESYFREQHRLRSMRNEIKTIISEIDSIIKPSTLVSKDSNPPTGIVNENNMGIVPIADQGINGRKNTNVTTPLPPKNSGQNIVVGEPNQHNTTLTTVVRGTNRNNTNVTTALPMNGFLNRNNSGIELIKYPKNNRKNINS
jgi:hypothetical protein